MPGAMEGELECSFQPPLPFCVCGVACLCHSQLFPQITAFPLRTLSVYFRISAFISSRRSGDMKQVSLIQMRIRKLFAFAPIKEKSPLVPAPARRQRDWRAMLSALAPTPEAEAYEGPGTPCALPLPSSQMRGTGGPN